MGGQITIRRADVENTQACLTYFSSILSNQLQNFKLRCNSLIQNPKIMQPALYTSAVAEHSELRLYFLFVCKRRFGDGLSV